MRWRASSSARPSRASTRAATAPAPTCRSSRRRSGALVRLGGRLGADRALVRHALRDALHLRLRLRRRPRRPRAGRPPPRGRAAPCPPAAAEPPSLAAGGRADQRAPARLRRAVGLRQPSSAAEPARAVTRGLGLATWLVVRGPADRSPGSSRGGLLSSARSGVGHHDQGGDRSSRVLPARRLFQEGVCRSRGSRLRDDEGDARSRGEDQDLRLRQLRPPRQAQAPGQEPADGRPHHHHRAPRAQLQGQPDPQARAQPAGRTRRPRSSACPCARELPAKLYYRIGEVAGIVGVEPHVLRYWETEFRSVRPQKSAKGQRIYSRRDVETLLKVKELLYAHRFTIAGARRKLREGGIEPAPPGRRRHQRGGAADARRAALAIRGESRGAAR